MSTPIGSGTQGFWIEPGEVRKAGDAARKVAQDMPEDIKTLFVPTDAAVTGLAGFQSAQALDDCLEAWTKALRSLAGMVEGAADAVDSSSKSFSQEDQERRNSFLGLAPYISGPPGPYAPGFMMPPSQSGER
ncbi:hypothetical protein [Streptomyces sp. ML-6]|uniref:WXG100 family type VII secretion target n=1 Tax=Streptomyces sp. ML-6 TaxID=2982693 RepID=UPI0024BF387D|nr:hypothetical protein [Streptomyces sp. ML-6]MDK0519754.1 hypothetical protein [Streptomyces sp. ML-6]